MLIGQQRLENNQIPSGSTTLANAKRYNDPSIPDLIGVDQEKIYNQVKNHTSKTSSYNNQGEEVDRNSNYSDDTTKDNASNGRYFLIGFLMLLVFGLGAVFGKKV